MEFIVAVDGVVLVMVVVDVAVDGCKWLGSSDVISCEVTGMALFVFILEVEVAVAVGSIAVEKGMRRDEGRSENCL